MQKNNSQHYNRLSMSLHWLMLLLMIGVYACIELKGNFAKGSDTRELLKQWHFMLGLSIFALVWLRLITRLFTSSPEIKPAPPQWQQIAAHLMHALLYALMIGAPLAGWIVLSAAEKPIPFFGLELPALTSPDRALAGQVKQWHELAGTVGYWLIGLHALAALAHHYLIKDNTLRRMLPKRSR